MLFLLFHFRHCNISFIISQLHYQCFFYNNIFLIAFLVGMHKSYVIFRLFLGLLLWDTFIMWQLYFPRFLKNKFLIILEIRYLLVRSNYVRKYVTITLRVGSSFLDYFFCITFAKRIEITLQLRFAFVKHFDIFSVTSQLRCLFDVVTFLMTLNNYVLFWYVWTMYGNNVIITFCFCSSLWRIFIMSQCYLFVLCSYVFWWR